MPLSATATENSRRLYDRALTIIAACPSHLYSEAGISGSVARGVADAFSDIEIGLWTSTLKDISVYRDWLLEFHPDIVIMRESIEADKRLYIEYMVDGVEVSLIWQTWDSTDDIISAITDNRLPADHTDPWMLYHLLPVGDAPRLHEYQRQVQTYPDGLRRALIESHLERWRWMLGVPKTFLAVSVIKRGELVDFRRRQLLTINSMLTILFAYNNLWQPDGKWYTAEIPRMTHTPERLIARLDMLLVNTDPDVLLLTMRDLMIDTMHTIADDFDVQDIITGLSAISLKS